MSLEGLRTTRVDRIGYLLEHLGAVVERQSDQAMQEQLGIGTAQHKVLRMVDHSPGISQREVADFLGCTEAGISRQVKLLAQKAMLIVQPDDEERRRKKLFLTPFGVKVSQAARSILLARRSTWFDGLDKKQQQALLQVLDTLHVTLCASGKPAACGRPYDLLDVYSIPREEALPT